MTDKKNRYETKYITIGIKADVKTSTADLGKFKGHANVFGNVDDQDDIVAKGAFKKTIKETGKKRALFFMHAARSIENLMGGAGSLKEDDIGLHTDGELMLKYSECSKAFDAIKGGIITEMSIGFRIVKCTWEKIKDTLIRTITEAKLFEISLIPVGMAANSLSTINSFKSVEDFESSDIYKYMIENKENKEFKDKCLSLFGIKPEEKTTLEEEPEIETTQKIEPEEKTTLETEKPEEESVFERFNRRIKK